MGLATAQAASRRRAPRAARSTTRRRASSRATRSRSPRRRTGATLGRPLTSRASHLLSSTSPHLTLLTSLSSPLPPLRFTCYAALAKHRASNIEDVSYQILLGEKKYFVSTDGGGERQQWFALIREPAGGVAPEPTAEDPHPKLTRLRKEFSCTDGDADGNVWDDFALELIEAAEEVTPHSLSFPPHLPSSPLLASSPHLTSPPLPSPHLTAPRATSSGATCTMARLSSPLSTRSGSGARGQRVPSPSAATPRTP